MASRPAYEENNCRWSGVKNLLLRGSPIIGEEFEPSEEVFFPLQCV